MKGWLIKVMARNKSNLEKIIERHRDYIERTRNELISYGNIEYVKSELTILCEFEKAINEIDNYCKERKRY